MSQDTSSKIPQSDPYIPVQAPGTPQDSLDEKLRAIWQSEIEDPIEYGEGVDAKYYGLDRDDFLAQIKAAFTEAGYTQGDNGTQAWNNEFAAKHHLMSGQEFYEAFERELDTMKPPYNVDIYRAAKRAAGLEGK